MRQINNRETGVTMDSAIIAIERWLKFAIDEHKTTVRKFYTLLGEYQKEALTKRNKVA